MSKDYGTFKKIRDSAEFQAEWQWYYTRELENGIIEAQNGPGRAWYHPNGLVTIFPTNGGLSPPMVVDAWPESVQSQCYKSPYKEYAVITGDDGVTRYYVMPEPGYRYNAKVEENKPHGLMLMPHPDKGYMPAHPIPDYDISVSRKQKKDAWVKWKGYLDFADVMWDLLPKKLDEVLRLDVHTKRHTIPLQHDDRSTWHTYVQFEKTMGTGVKEGIKEKVERLIMKRDLPYNVKRVSELQPSHTGHWDRRLIKELGKAGRLDYLEEE